MFFTRAVPTLQSPNVALLRRTGLPLPLVLRVEGGLELLNDRAALLFQPLCLRKGGAEPLPTSSVPPERRNLGATTPHFFATR